jgi:hypothetical protein
LLYPSRETWRFRGSAMRDWGRILIRSFGIANWFYGLTGSYFLVDGLRRVHHFGPYPYEAKAYYFYVTINVVFLFAYFLTGYWLILIRRRGAILSNYVFSMEILFEVLSAWVSLYLVMSSNPTAASVGMSLGAVAGIGNMGTAVQILTGYPPIALVALNLARRHVDRNRSWNASQPSRDAGRTQV